MRSFLGWQQPLRSLADAILARGSGAWLDFHELAVVVPSGRAGRRLLELLTVEAAKRGSALSPPRIITSGRAPEIFRMETARTPGDLTIMLAWMEALALVRKPAGDEDLADRLDRVRAMATCHYDLAAAGLEPAQAKEKLTDVLCDQGFWETFTKSYALYGEVLRKWGYEETHSARRLAIERKELSCPGPVILAGVIELPWALREMLQRFPTQVEILVFAPAELKDRFDELGGLLPQKWMKAPTTRDEVVEFVDGPDEQADAVMKELLRYQGRYKADEIIVGVPDDEVASLIELRLTRAGIPARTPIGLAMGNGTVCKLLSLVAGYLGERTFGTLAALARHPDLLHHLRKLGVKDDLPGLLDRYQSEHFLRELPSEWPGKGEEAEHIGLFVTSLDKELESLREPATDKASGWAERLAAFLSRVYEERLLNPNDPHQTALFTEATAVGTLLRELSEIRSAGPDLTAADAIAVLLKVLEGQPIPEQGDEPAVELLGWLELAMDDAPALVVTSMNEGVIPASPGANPVLPEPARQCLGLPGDGNRFARDNYVLHVLLNARKDLRLIAARRTGDGHPRLPSRLLLPEAADGAAKRLLAFFNEKASHATVTIPGSLTPGSEKCSIDSPPKPNPNVSLPESMSVTSFRAYLECPYRYYLSNVLELKAVTDTAQEMDALVFGSLMHKVLQPFPKTIKDGRGTHKAIRDSLLGSLEDELRRRFGSLSPRVRLQAEVLRRRLEAFATWQAEWAAQGYIILHTELSFRAQDKKRRLMVDDQSMGIHGRIDRIDVRDDGSEAVIFDYKTSNNPTTPEKSHFDGERWTDLQLPLYRHLIEGTAGLPKARRLGYITLPSDVNQTRELIAGWTEEDLAGADEAAATVVRNIRKRVFWPPARIPGNWMDAFADICRSTRFVAQTNGEEDVDEVNA